MRHWSYLNRVKEGAKRTIQMRGGSHRDWETRKQWENKRNINRENNDKKKRQCWGADKEFKRRPWVKEGDSDGASVTGAAARDMGIPASKSMRWLLQTAVSQPVSQSVSHNNHHHVVTLAKPTGIPIHSLTLPPPTCRRHSSQIPSTIRHYPSLCLSI